MAGHFELIVDAMGYLAAACVLTAFCMKRMLALRIAAIAGNLLFLGYAVAAGLTPVFVLHLLLLPVNVVRLVQVLRLPMAARPGALTVSAAPRKFWIDHGVDWPRAVVQVRGARHCFAPPVPVAQGVPGAGQR